MESSRPQVAGKALAQAPIPAGQDFAGAQLCRRQGGVQEDRPPRFLGRALPAEHLGEQARSWGPRKNGSGVESDGAQPVIRATRPVPGPEQQRLQELLEDVSSIECEAEFCGGVCSPRWQNRKGWGTARDGHITSTHRVGSRLRQAGVWTPRAVTPTHVQVWHQHLCQVGAVPTAAIW